MGLNVEILHELEQSVSGDVLSDDYSLGLYSTDASIYQIVPLAIVLPKEKKDVEAVVRIAGEHGLTLLPRGGGTSLAGQTVGKSIVIDFSRYMNRLIEVNPEERWARVQPGMVLDELNQQLKSYGLHFAPDPATSSRANVGGMVGNNSSGTKSILYGKTVDHVLEAEILLPDMTRMNLRELSDPEWKQKTVQPGREGEIYKGVQELLEQHAEEIRQRFPKVMRRVGGYNLDEFLDERSRNLSKLITGSEGTLAVTLELKLNLEPLPKHKSVVVAHFAELKEAIRAVKPMLDFQPAAVEILDCTVLRMSRENLTTRRHSHFIDGDPAAVLITEFYADSVEEVMERPRRMIEALGELGLGYAFPHYPEGKEYEDVWLTRKKGLGLMLGIKGDKKPLPFIEDACVPVEVLPEYIEEVLAVCRKYETEVSMYAHASVGVIHVRPILDLRQKSDIENLVHIAGDTFDLVMKYEGSWSGEHGDGLVRSSFNERFFGPELYGAFKKLKQLFDPEWRMNPGKIVDAPPMDEHLRYGAGYEDREVRTEFHYRTENSFRESVHMCTGVGECRKMLGGTMCPSYRATRNEEHSTRGRANALRLSMSGQLNGEGMASHRLNEILDLCLSCKACKSECPSNVDMAKMKSDVRQIYYDEHGLGLRDYMIGKASEMAALFSGSMSGVVNQIQGTTLFRSILESVAGFDRRRVLPAYSRKSLSKWFQEHVDEFPKSDRKVVLFADTFVNYHEPYIGKAAVRLLNECGYEVILADVGCCQRPRISHGLLRDAKSRVVNTLKGLHPYLEEGLPVLVCEPSCASSLNDDLPDLIDDESMAARLRGQIQLLDQFLANELKAGNLAGRFYTDQSDLHIHGHCHQKALYGTESIWTLLDQPGANVTEISSGCCGMAGSFGYEKEHYEISEAIGEQSLFPTVRALESSATLIASGFSCRHQIEHFTDVEPRHWVEVVRYQA